ncbi:YqaJ viral recombinase family protein [Turicibacter sanguinis]|uniref:YqaJ viral recombinase family nuclease n=1 Tax=Turicibacter sanguinis TaxID=154288 RepID=UPI0018A9A5F5|nr:YqaJ viral recombinase family protein [Turicibacter sanguinis]MDB8554068.1 YqaJ viral recombinase family protein [Turicibacter sanguinis]
MEINIKDFTREEWLAERNKGIGGSDIATILGLNKWKSPLQLFLEKTGKVVVEDLSDKEVIYWGNVLEDVVAKEFERRTGKKVRRRHVMFCDDNYPYMRANVDREVVGENAVLECKTTDKRNADQWSDDQVPANYILQCQWYMMIKGYEKAYIACLIGGNQFVFKEIERDEELIEMIKGAAVNFWETNVLGDIEPDADYVDKAAYKQLTLSPDAIDLSDDINFKIELLEEVKRDEKTLKQTKDKLEAEIKQAMQGHEVGLTSKYRVNWKKSVQKRFDSKRFKEEQAELNEKYTKEIHTERLTIKEAI